MQDYQNFYTIETPFKNAINPQLSSIHDQFIESILCTSNPNNHENHQVSNSFNNNSLDPFTGFNFNMELLAKDEEFNCNIYKGYMPFSPNQPGLNFTNLPYFGNYCDEENFKKPMPLYDDEDDNTAAHSIYISSPDQALSRSESCSVSGGVNYQLTPQFNANNGQNSLISPKIKAGKVQSGSKKISKKIKLPKKPRKNKRTSERLKNIAKNYGKNCAAFAISELGLPYVTEILNENEIPSFKELIKQKIPMITNIANFRDMLLASPNDSQEIKKYKKAFQHASIIFIREYSANWIFHSPRINDVKGHIQARSKMLRRVQNPINFTYIH